jgi:hypothetical protein
MDLVDDPHESRSCPQRIRIRAGTRLPRPRSKLDTRSTPAGAEDPKQDHYQQMGTAREQSGVVSWPPDDHSPALDNLHDILNPPGYVGNVRGTWDQRSFIYSTGGGAKGSVKALVLISFDPGIHLKGIRSFNDLSSASPSQGDPGTMLREIHAILHSDEGKGKEEDIIHKCSASLDEGAIVEHKSSASWASYELAQYSIIGSGCHFAV